MIIGFDAKRAVRNMTGLGNYSRFVIDAMSEVYPDNRYLLYTPKFSDHPRLHPIIDRDNIEIRQPETWFGRKFGAAWRTGAGITAQIRRDRVDIYHGLSNELPLNIAKSGAASVLTVHDLIYRRVPRDYSAIDRAFDNWKYGASARNATRIIAISECTRRDLISDFGINPDKIDVIYQGCHPIFHTTPSDALCADIQRKYNLPERFIIAVGTVQSRKNQLLAVKSLRGIDPEVKLVIVGRHADSYAREIDDYIAKNRLSDRVIMIEGASLQELVGLYSLATVSAYVSRYEGFGIPVIESLAVGAPVIAATGSCLEEAGGDGAIYVNPDSVEQFIDAANRIIGDPALRATLVGNGRRHIAKFNNADFARLTMETYRKALADFRD